ncbi:MAG: hypothetical protein HY907_06345 [Deltaproteobacteria bacterium]|nr:hypothetical protein [Deltaproteobacteria bacterium]
MPHSPARRFRGQFALAAVFAAVLVPAGCRKAAVGDAGLAAGEAGAAVGGAETGFALGDGERADAAAAGAAVDARGDSGGEVAGDMSAVPNPGVPAGADAVAGGGEATVEGVAVVGAAGGAAGATGPPGDDAVRTPIDLLAVPGGAVAVWSEAREAEDGAETSTLFWRGYDAAGVPRGEVRRLKETTGRIGRIRLARAGDRTVAVWCATNALEPDAAGAARETVIHAAAWLDERGERLGEVEVIAIDRLDERTRDSSAVCPLAVLSDGDDVLVARSHGAVRCRHEEERAWCLAIGIERLAFGAPAVVLHRESFLAPTRPISAMVRTDHGVVLPVFDEHIYGATFLVLAAARPGEVVAEDTSFCLRGYPSESGCAAAGAGGSGAKATELVEMSGVAVAWTGDVLVASNGEAIAAWREGAPLGWPEPAGECEREASCWPRLTGTALKCDGEGLRAIVTGSRSVRVVMDPAAAGVSFHWRDVLAWAASGPAPLAAAWTGEAMLVVPGREEDDDLAPAGRQAEIRAVRCRGGVLPVDSLGVP